MAQITPVIPTMAGVNPSPVSVSAGGDTVLNTRGNTHIQITNANGSSVTVTFAIAAAFASRPADSNYPAETVGNNAVAIPNGQSRIFGPIKPCYTDPSTGAVALTYSASTGVTISAWEHNSN